MTALQYVLRGLIPYTEQNIKLAFKPHQFFNDLEKISKYKKSTIKQAFYQAEQKELIRRVNRLPKLTAAGKKTIVPFRPEKLKSNAKLMVAFDIPEELAYKRRRLRYVLETWEFQQVQRSLWTTDRNYRKLLAELSHELDIKRYIKLFESLAISMKDE